MEGWALIAVAAPPFAALAGVGPGHWLERRRAREDYERQVQRDKAERRHQREPRRWDTAVDFLEQATLVHSRLLDFDGMMRAPGPPSAEAKDAALRSRDQLDGVVMAEARLRFEDPDLKESADRVLDALHALNQDVHERQGRPSPDDGEHLTDQWASARREFVEAVQARVNG